MHVALIALVSRACSTNDFLVCPELSVGLDSAKINSAHTTDSVTLWLLYTGYKC